MHVCVYMVCLVLVCCCCCCWFLEGGELQRCSHGAELSTMLQTAYSFSRDESLILKSEDHWESLGMQWNAHSSGKKTFPLSRNREGAGGRATLLERLG